MTEVNDSVLTVDFENVASSESRSLLLDELTSRSILVLQVAGLGGGDEEVVVGKETESGGFDVILQFAEKGNERAKRSACCQESSVGRNLYALQLGSVLIVNEDVLLLGDGVEGG